MTKQWPLTHLSRFSGLTPIHLGESFLNAILSRKGLCILSKARLKASATLLLWWGQLVISPLWGEELSYGIYYR